MSRTLRSVLLPFLLFVSVVIAIQWRQSAYTSEFGGHADEAGHYVTGVFIRKAFEEFPRAVAAGPAGFVKEYKAFAQAYYENYPKIGLGMWPPAFHIVQACWTALFGQSHTSIMLLMAVMASTLALLLFMVAREEVGLMGGLAAAVILLTLPLITRLDSMVMAEIQSALTMYAACLCFARFMEKGRNRDAIFFGAFAAVAILTKGTGLALGLVPVIAIILTGKYRILSRWSLWVAALIVVVIAGPWTVYFAKVGVDLGGWEETTVMGYVRSAFPFFSLKLLVASGISIAVCALFGVVSQSLRRPAYPPRVAIHVSLLLAVWVFQSLVPASQEERHICSTMPAIVFLAVLGVSEFSRRIQAGPVFAGVFLSVLALSNVLIGILFPPDPVAFFSVGRQVRWSPVRISDKGCHGYAEIAEYLIQHRGNVPRILVSSDAIGEGMLISEVVLRDPEPPLRIDRASKVLAESKWSGARYESRFQSADALGAFISGSIYGFLVLESPMDAAKHRPHHDLIIEAAKKEGSVFALVQEIGSTRLGVPQAKPVYLFSRN